MVTKWFDRTFNFNCTPGDYILIYQRLITATLKIADVIVDAPEHALTKKTDGKWSVKEHVGHLAVLEPLWRTRILDIQSGAPTLTPADLDNTTTENAQFNNYSIESLIAKFSQERNETILLLSHISAASISNKSFHPRLKEYMGITEHLYFIAEHDDHHTAYIDRFLRIIK